MGLKTAKLDQWIGLGKLCSKIWLLCPKAVLVKTMYYARETAYYARIMLQENSILIGTKTQKVVHFRGGGMD